MMDGPATLRVAPGLEPAIYTPAIRPRRTLKHDDTFAVLDAYGDIGASPGGSDGVFHADTRFLSRFEFLIDGEQPLLLGSSVRDDNAFLTADLTNPDIFVGDRLKLPKDTLHVVRTIFLWRGTLHQRFGLSNHGDQPIAMSLRFSFNSDFADLFEVRGKRRPRRGTVRARTIGNNQVVLNYQGLDLRARCAQLLFDPPPNNMSHGSCSYGIRLAPGARCSIFVSARYNDAGPQPPNRFFRGMVGAARELKRATRGTATVETPHHIFNEVLQRSAADLNMLITDTPQGPYPYAGIPWYSTTFGRDGLITALQTLWCRPEIARGVLRRLAAHQADGEDPFADSQPGKILHETRGGEMAALREVPFARYYGSVDSTPLFVLVTGLYVERTGDTTTLRDLWPNIEAALAWIDGPADPDQDGFIEYVRATDQGLFNQGWKDSQNAVFHSDGRLAEGPIALAEVQGYVYAAKRAAGRLARMMGQHATADKLDQEAGLLAERFERAFWCPELETYAIALDGEKARCEVRTSNAGQVLFSGIAAPRRAKLVADGLLRSSFFSGWGIRTVSTLERRYNPMSYHNGSIWPHDNAMIALGLARYGFTTEIDRVFRGLFEAAAHMDLRRLPELFCGFQRTRGRGPTMYPVACSPQAWAASAPYALLQAMLGLEFDPSLNEIRLRRPRLPSFLDQMTVRNLQLGRSSVDVSIHRHSRDVSLHVNKVEGDVQVSALYC